MKTEGYRIKCITASIEDHGEEKRLPCFVLTYDGVIVGFTGLEDYLIVKYWSTSDSNLRVAAKFICPFLNFIFLDLGHQYLSDVTISDIANYMQTYMYNENGTAKRGSTCTKCLGHIMSYLQAAYECLGRPKNWSIPEPDLYGELLVSKDHMFRKYPAIKWKPPVDVGRLKYRYLPLDYMKLLVEAAAIYDPILVLPLLLAFCGGLRRGEIVNCSIKSIHIRDAAYGRTLRILVDLTENALWAKKDSKIGKIKKFRTQRIYDDFCNEVKSAYEQHLIILENMYQKHGTSLPLTEDSPILIMNDLSPMTSNTYSGRVRRLFYDHFLPMLKQRTKEQGSESLDGPYIEQYEKNYPGHHMTRHWYTMYLIVVARLNHDEISVQWRGDSPHSNSITNYIHMHEIGITEFARSAAVYQEALYDIAQRPVE